ncbi:MAG: TetR/AcrR family transcriptional regulator [Akkermansiaceae bacterium]|nr:TetR/AcrR family transcriptional regulator [Armatimonadota bacterium]
MNEKINNRERILDAALRLFNETGTANVSTNLIAEGAGISVGNLYYHFKNKEQIVRALFERFSDDTDRAFALPEDRVPTPDDLDTLLRLNFVVLWRHRFFYRERIALLQRDPELMVRYRVVRQRGFDGFSHLLRSFTDAGFMRLPVTPEEESQLAQVCWIVSDFFLPFLESDGGDAELSALEARHQEQGASLLRLVLRPYLVADSVNNIER